MAKINRVDLMKADRRAVAAQNAMDSTEQAGRGLMKCFNAMKANTVTAKTRYDLVIAAGYINDAIASLLECEADELPVGDRVVKL